MIYSGSATKLLFAILYSRVPNKRVTSLDQQAPLRRRKRHNVAYTLSGTKLNTESYFEDTGKSNSPIKSKLKDTGKSNSLKSRWVPMSERVFSPQPVTQYNPITGEVRKESEKATVVKKNYVVSKSKVAAVVSEKSNVINESVVKSIEKSTIVKDRDVMSKVGISNVFVVVCEKSAVDDNPKVSKVLDESNKSAVVTPVIDNVPVATETDKETEPVVVAVESVAEKDNPKVTSKVSDESVKESVKVPVVKKSVKASSVVTDKPSSENQDKIDVVADKRSSVVAEKVDVVVKKSVKVFSLVGDKPSSVVTNKVDVVKDKVDVVANKVSNALKNKMTGKGKKPVVGKDKDKPKNIASNVEKEKFKPNTKQKEDDRKKKLKGKSKKDVFDFELETDVVDYSSDEADRKRKKLKIKAGLKRKRSGSDSSDSSKSDTKSIKILISKLENKVKKQESDEDSVKKKESDEDSISKKGKKKEKQLTPKEAAHEEYLLSFPSFHARTTHSSLFSAIKNTRVDILRFLTDIVFSSLHNVSIDHLPLKLGWFAVSKFKSYILIFDSSDKIKVTTSKIHDMLGVPFGGYSLFDLDERETDHEFVRKWAGQFYPLELKKVCVNDIARKLIAAQEIDFLFKVNFLTLFTNTMDDDGGNVNNDADDCDGNRDEKDVNEGDKDLNGSNLSFGFSKISLEDFGNDSGPVEKDKAVEGNPTEQRIVVEENKAEEGEIMSTPENFTQWLEKNVDLVGEGDLFGDNSATLEAMNQEITPEKLPTQKGSPSPKKELENIFEAHFGMFVVYGVRLNLETLAPSLWLDANVIDYWGTVLNHEQSFRANESKSKHFFPTGCIKKLFTRHLKQYGYIRHIKVAKVKHTIPKLKWKTKENFHDYEIFPMLYMETFDGGPASNLDCGLPVESQLQRDMLRRLRFKFATKILLHEINVHAGKMLELAKDLTKQILLKRWRKSLMHSRKGRNVNAYNLCCSFGSLILIELLLCFSSLIMVELIWSSLRMVELFNYWI
nr:hypothetical protein [Tanacetum cinerariifolium]